MASKRSPNRNHWCFTSYLCILPSKFDKNYVRYCVYQREVCPESKKEHYQGYIEFFDSKRMGQVKKILGECHLEPRHGSRTEARLYCLKKESSIPGTQFEFGEWREDISRKRKLCDMLRTDMTLMQIVDETPHLFVMYHRGLAALFARREEIEALKFRTVQVEVLIGPTGSGKTKRATSGLNWFIMPCSKTLWLDGYHGQKTLVIDDFYGGISYSVLLRILDGHALQLPVKGGFIWARWTKVVITSNVEPKLWYKRGLTPALKRRINKVIYMTHPLNDDSDSDESMFLTDALLPNKSV